MTLVLEVSSETRTLPKPNGPAPGFSLRHLLESFLTLANSDLFENDGSIICGIKSPVDVWTGPQAEV